MIKRAIIPLIIVCLCVVVSIPFFVLGFETDSPVDPTPTLQSDNNDGQTADLNSKGHSTESNEKPTTELIHSFIHTSFAAEQVGVFSSAGYSYEIGKNDDIYFLSHKTYQELIKRTDFFESMESYYNNSLSPNIFFTYAIFCEILLTDEVMDLRVQEENFSEDYPSLFSLYSNFETNETP